MLESLAMRPKGPGVASSANHWRPHALRKRLWASVRRAVFAALVGVFASALIPASAAIPVKPIISVIAAITKDTRALADEEIVRLARLAREINGTKTVGKVLGEQKLPPEVLEDAYLRIALQQQRLPRREAEGMFERLRAPTASEPRCAR